MSHLKKDSEWCYYHSQQLVGLIQESKDASFLLKPTRTLLEGTYQKQKWFGMPLHNILPVLVSQHFQDFATKND